MHLGDEIHRSVVFVGHRDSTNAGFRAAGTGFLVAKNNAGFLVTARHVAELLSGAPFALRINRRGKAEIIDFDDAEWTFHQDPSVDLAGMALHLSPAQGYDVLYQPTSLFVDDDFVAKTITAGDLCYTVGLFKFIQGEAVNLPIVHAGHVALIPARGERVPVWNKLRKKLDNVEGYLVESHAISGASGSPVVVRRIIGAGGIRLEDGTTTEVQWPEAKIRVLGLYQGAWFAPPDEALRGAINASPADVVPVGVGVVVPAAKIVELLATGALADGKAFSPSRRRTE